MRVRMREEGGRWLSLVWLKYGRDVLVPGREAGSVLLCLLGCFYVTGRLLGPDWKADTVL